MRVLVWMAVAVTLVIGAATAPQARATPLLPAAAATVPVSSGTTADVTPVRWYRYHYRYHYRWHRRYWHRRYWHRRYWRRW